MLKKVGEPRKERVLSGDRQTLETHVQKILRAAQLRRSLHSDWSCHPAGGEVQAPQENDLLR